MMFDSGGRAASKGYDLFWIMGGKMIDKKKSHNWKKAIMMMIGKSAFLQTYSATYRSARQTCLRKTLTTSCAKQFSGKFYLCPVSLCAKTTGFQRWPLWTQPRRETCLKRSKFENCDILIMCMRNFGYSLITFPQQSRHLMLIFHVSMGMLTFDSTRLRGNISLIGLFFELYYHRSPLTTAESTLLAGIEYFRNRKMTDSSGFKPYIWPAHGVVRWHSVV